MSDRKLAKAVQSLFREIGKLYRSMTKAMVAWLLRAALVVNRKTRSSIAGFVLPTTVFLILVVALTAGALTFRAFNSSTRAINETQSQTIYNAATPSADRARSKLEFLFDANKDNRFPGGVPSEEFLVSMLLNTNPPTIVKGRSAPQLLLNGVDPYTLPDETRIDINGDGVVDNAWRYRADTNSDGTADATIAYSVIFSTPADRTTTPTARGWQRLIGMTDRQKASGLNESNAADATPRISYARSGPLSNNTPTDCGIQATTGGSSVEGGWYQDSSNTSVLRKNFQVDALVIPDAAGTTGASNTFATLEFTQDRVLNRGNKWGAWFRNDLEIFPGPPFQWNGAMHTEGSLIVGNNNFSAYLISAPNSCFWYESASEVTVTDINNATTGDNLQGQVVSGRIGADDNQGSSLFYIWSSNFNLSSKVTLDPGSDSLASSSPFPVSIDPTLIQIRNGYGSRSATNPTNRNAGLRSTAYDNSTLARRVFNKAETAPYVDDLYRADDRYGPKQKYSDQVQIPASKRAGDVILATDNVSTNSGSTVLADPALISATPAAGADPSQVGLDGYWERRARNQGLRILVGQRLELGNSNGWVAPQNRSSSAQDLASTTIPTPPNNNFTDLRQFDYSAANVTTADPYTSDNEGDPLYPPHSLSTISHEQRQRRELRDNLAAVQGTAIYHGAVSTDYPIACLASTAHHGSPYTLRQSINFVPTYFVNSAPASTPTAAEPGTGRTSAAQTVLLTDFFNGRGTNGWEFETPSGSEAQFRIDIADPTSSLRIALRNLAQFAGDHISDARTGAFPPTQEAGQIHPDPEFSMWGNFSNLRRAVARLDAGTGVAAYDALSIADKTFLQTAACTVGMLAYNVDRVQRFDPRNQNNDTGSLVYNLTIDLFQLMDGVVNETATIPNYEVLPKSQLATYNYNAATATAIDGNYNPRDYDNVPAEAFLGKLRELYVANGNGVNDARLRLAELIFAHFQVQRDRTYGFRPSPAANTWNYNPFVAVVKNKLTTWSSACDPNQFAFNTLGTISRQAGDAAAAAAGYASVSQGELMLTRLTLSRLCGTVIPPGGVRDRPGDTGYPARNANANGATPSTTFPHIPVRSSTTYPQGAPTYQSSNPAFRSTSTALNTAPYNAFPYLAATVAPKWPSLFYLFPEFDHNHDGRPVNASGAVTGDVLTFTTTIGTETVDARQPGSGTGASPGLLPVPGTATTVATTPLLPAAFQPWPEPYITDAYIRQANAGTTPAVYRVVDSISPAMDDLITTPVAYTTNKPSYRTGSTQSVTDPQSSQVFTFEYLTFGNPVLDRPVHRVMLRPKRLPTASTSGVSGGAGFTTPFPMNNTLYPVWQLPVSTLPSGTLNAQNVPPNRIFVPNTAGVSTTGATAIVPFLDRVPFNGREWLPTRMMDIDLGMLRRTRPANQNTTLVSSYNSNLTTAGVGDVWLPVSGIVYAFREDAVREDAINRPAPTGATLPATPNPPQQTNVRDATALGTDPPLANQGISVKAVDFAPDPDRRPHGFRLRNGTQLKRHSSMSIPDTENIRGLSLFTDSPVYIMGNFNLHQSGGEDSGDPNDANARLEEFVERLPDTAGYNETQFYINRVNRNSNFAEPTIDRWRPSEILSDAISVISETFCDGSAIDTFMQTDASGSNNGSLSVATYSGTRDTGSLVNFPNAFRPYQSTTGNAGGAAVYNNNATGLYGTGCTNGGRTSFLNQNSPNVNLPVDIYKWARENPSDLFSPIKVSRNGNGLVEFVDRDEDFPPGFTSATSPPPNQPARPQFQGEYTAAPVSGGYYNIGNGRPIQGAQDARVNSIIVSGLSPSRSGQSYGGMHNFPRFLEDWTRLWFSGSFLQLNFSNYATSPFDQQVWEPGITPTAGNERISYYSPPNRLWGYDVALQKAPAGPAASRFVTANRDRNEFYKELPANDPYIANLCNAVRTNPPTGLPTGVNLANLRCPT